MNVKAISANVGKALLVSALFMLLSCGVSIFYGLDSSFAPLLLSFIITFSVGIFPLIFVRDTPALRMHEALTLGNHEEVGIGEIVHRHVAAIQY